MEIGIIGVGNMGQALAEGMISAGFAKPENIHCSRNNIHLLGGLQKLGCHVTTDNIEVVKSSQVLIIAVKPYVVPEVLAQIYHYVNPNHLIISVAMGITCKQIEDSLPTGTRVIRVVPNTPCLIREGVSMFSCGNNCLGSESDIAKSIFSSVGFCDKIDEKLLDAVTGLSGAGPAYVYMAIEALADGGVKMGIKRDVSMHLAAQTLLGASKMVMQTGKHPGLLKDEVCSPAGATIRGVHELEKNGLRSSLITAVEAATLHCKKLSS